MKRIIILIASFFPLAHSIAADDESFLKESVKSITSSLTASGKEVLSGIKEGIDQGRSSGSSIDGAIIINDKANLNKYVDINVVSSERDVNNNYLLMISINNKSESTVRLINLSKKNNIFVLDKNRYSAYLGNIQSDITIPKKTSQKTMLSFINVEGDPILLRLYDMDIVIPANINTYN